MNCKLCGKEFAPKNDRQYYCSAKCKANANKERRMADMENETACGWCGEWFVKHHHKQLYCCKECSKLAERHSKQMSKIKMREQKNKEKQEKHGLSIQNMLDIMDSLSQERGRVVQYGEVQSMLYTGKLKEKDGVLK